MAPSTSRLSELAKDLSPASSILAKLLKALNDEDVMLHQLATIVESDPVLAGNVLKAANSGLFGRSQRILSVPRAIALLGSTRIQNIALAFSVLRAWGKLKYPWWWSQKKFSRHSLATATFCDLLAQKVPTKHSDGAFVVGLLHGLGKLAFVLLCPKNFSYVVPALDDAVLQSRFEDAEHDVLGCTHATAAAVLAEQWRLPAEIQTAIAQQSSEPPGSQSEYRLEQILHFSHDAVGILGFSNLMCHPSKDASIAAMLEVLGIKEDVKDVIARFQENFQQLNLE